MRKLENKSGFTLIEIIVVLIIVGILAAIALPNLFSNVQTSQGSAMLQAASAMESPLEACLVKNSATVMGAGNCAFTTIFPGSAVSADEMPTSVTGFEVVLDQEGGTIGGANANYELLGESAGTEAFDLFRNTAGAFSCTAGAAPYNNVC